MAAFFIPGEVKVRPGVYFRYENYGTPMIAGADDGKCATTLRSNWGPVGKAVLLEKAEDIADIYGTGGTGGTTDAPYAQFVGGAKSVRAVRLGTGGTNGSHKITDTDGTEVLTMAMKYPGSRAFAVTIRPTLDEEDTGELLLLDGTTVLERHTFSTEDDAGQVASLLDAVTSSGSEYFTLTKIESTEYALATVSQVSITPGTDPTADVAAYSAAFTILEAFRWNVLSIDTTDTAVHAMMQLFLNRIFEGGKWVMGVVSESTSVDFDTRMTHASAYNDYNIVYVGNGFVDTAGVVYEGYLAAARIAGLIAGTPSTESITHMAISGGVEITEALTNDQYCQAIKAGMLTFSVSSANTVWVEQGINTLVLPDATEDEGWKKIKRVKVRLELFQRLNDTVEALTGKVNNDSDGRATIIQVSNGVCNAMVAEKKLLAGAYVELSTDTTPQGDSAWFTVYADDIDALEKLYYTFKFRFAPETV